MQQRTPALPRKSACSAGSLVRPRLRSPRCSKGKSIGGATIGSLNRSNIGTPGENAGATLESAHVDPVAGAVCRPAVGAVLQFRGTSLFGFPFFYWYQLAWVPITSLLIWLVYRSRTPDETPEGHRHGRSDRMGRASVFIFFFALVTVMGFFAARWKAGPVSEHLDEWGLGGRQFGTWITWFLVGGDFYTAYTVIAVPALVYAVGAYGFFALPYTIIVYPFVFAVMPCCGRGACQWPCHRGRCRAWHLPIARAGTGGGDHRHGRDHALYRAATDRHGGGDQGDGPDRRTADCRRLHHPRALHLQLGPARTRADRLRQGHHDLYRGAGGGRRGARSSSAATARCSPPPTTPSPPRAARPASS